MSTMTSAPKTRKARIATIPAPALTVTHTPRGAKVASLTVTGLPVEEDVYALFDYSVGVDGEEAEVRVITADGEHLYRATFVEEDGVDRAALEQAIYLALGLKPRQGGRLYRKESAFEAEWGYVTAALALRVVR